MMTRTSVMSVTASPWIPTATREAVRDTTPVYDTVTSCWSVYVCVCVSTYQLPEQRERQRRCKETLFCQKEAGLVYLSALESDCD